MEKQQEAKFEPTKFQAAMVNSMVAMGAEIAEMRDMAAILASLIREYIEPVVETPPPGSEPRVVELHEDEIRQLFFAGHDVERRARELQVRYQNGWTAARVASGLAPL